MKPPAGGKCRDCWGNPKGCSGFKELIDTYKRNAAKHKREFGLSDDCFRNLTSKCCHYCGQEPKNIKSTKARSKWGDYVYNGIDRIDNQLGYTETNCVACCMICNRAKNNMSYDEFMNYLNRIKKHI